MNRGQIPVMIAIIGAIAVPIASVFVAWVTASGTANDKISEVKTEVRVVEEREQNRYLELKNTVNRIENKLDKLIDTKYGILK